MLSFYLHLGLPSGLLPSGLPTKIVEHDYTVLQKYVLYDMWGGAFSARGARNSLHTTFLLSTVLYSAGEGGRVFLTRTRSKEQKI